MALALETRSVSKGVRYHESRRTPWLTQRVSLFQHVPIKFDPLLGRQQQIFDRWGCELDEPQLQRQNV